MSGRATPKPREVPDSLIPETSEREFELYQVDRFGNAVPGRWGVFYQTWVRVPALGAAFLVMSVPAK